MKVTKTAAISATVIMAIFFISGALFSSEKRAKRENIMENSNSDLNTNGFQQATFAGGCFWCVESDFEKVEGVKEVISGYTGGHTEDPTYKEVSSGTTGHAEAVRVIYDPDVVTYDQLLDVFWRSIDPTDGGGQFVDRGSQYRSEIFYHDAEQKKAAEASKAKLEKSGVFDDPIKTGITQLKTFYRAEEYHQDYYKKSGYRYKFYRWNSGRDRFLEKTWQNRDRAENQTASTKEKKAWSRPDDDTIKQMLSPLQYRVTQEDATENPFDNEYWDNKREGIYVDIVSGEPLFSSQDKFDSGTGWPSFTTPLEPSNIVENEDRSLFMVRTEVRSRHGDSHLGHLFKDGPAPTGLRYCINSASLRFVPKNELEKEGYGKYYQIFFHQAR